MLANTAHRNKVCRAFGCVKDDTMDLLLARRAETRQSVDALIYSLLIQRNRA